jgi:hypothetical protein
MLALHFSGMEVKIEHIVKSEQAKMRWGIEFVFNVEYTPHHGSRRKKPECHRVLPLTVLISTISTPCEMKKKRDKYGNRKK